MAMTLRLTEDQDRTLTRLAAALHVSKQEAAIQAIEEQSARVSVAGDVKEWTDFALERYASLLDRLAQ